MRILNALLALAFFLFVAFQYNDPDPLPWMLAYGAVGTLCALAALGGHFPYADLILAAGLAAWLATLVPGVAAWVADGMPSIAGAMKAETPHIEETREFLGLAMAIAALLHLWRLARRTPPEAPNDGGPPLA